MSDYGSLFDFPSDSDDDGFYGSSLNASLVAPLISNHVVVYGHGRLARNSQGDTIHCTVPPSITIVFWAPIDCELLLSRGKTIASNVVHAWNTRATSTPRPRVFSGIENAAYDEHILSSIENFHCPFGVSLERAAPGKEKKLSNIVRYYNMKNEHTIIHWVACRV